MLVPWKKHYNQHKQHIKKHRHYLANIGLCSQSYGFSSSHVGMCELDYEDSWATKNWCFWTLVWRGILRAPWTALKSNQSILKEISPEYSLERLILKLKLQYFGHLMWRTDSLEQTLILGKIEGGRRRGWKEDEMVGWHHQLNGHEFGWTPAVGDRQRGPACCSPWGRRFGHSWATELNWTEMFGRIPQWLGK